MVEIAIWLVFYLKKKKKPRKYPISGENITLIKQFKYLGISLDTNLTFKPHVKNNKNTKVKSHKPQVCKELFA